MRSTLRPGSRLSPRLLASLLLSTLLAACAAPSYRAPTPPKGLQVLEQEQQQALILASREAALERLARVGWPLQRAAAAFCPKPLEAAIGIRLANRFFYPEALRPTALRQLGLGDALQVTGLIAGSPAEQAGVQRGDHLIQLDGRDLPVGEAAPRKLGAALTRLRPDLPAQLLIARQGQSPQTLILRPAALCRYPIALLPRDEINAYADHRSIQVTQGLLGFASDDWDLAFILAHELAHNLLGHVPATLRNGVAGGMIDLWLLASGVPSPGLGALAGSRVYAQAFENEADYLALYLLARAGYRLDQSPDYWRRVAAWRLGGATPRDGASHPDSSRRYLAMQQTLAEIRRKQAAGLPLNPEPLDAP